MLYPLPQSLATCAGARQRTGWPRIYKRTKSKWTISLANTIALRKAARIEEDVHKRYFQRIRDFRNDRAFGEEVEESFTDRVRERRDKDTESDHLGRKE